MVRKLRLPRSRVAGNPQKKTPWLKGMVHRHDSRVTVTTTSTSTTTTTV